MISTITSSSELSGVRIGSEEIQRRWELVLRKNDCLLYTSEVRVQVQAVGWAVPDDAVRDG